MVPLSSFASKGATQVDKTQGIVNVKKRKKQKRAKPPPKDVTNLAGHDPDILVNMPRPVKNTIAKS